MEPSSKESSGLGMQSLAGGEQFALPPSPSEGQKSGAEQSAATSERGAGSRSPATAMPALPLALPTAPSATDNQASDVTPTSASSSLQIAEDKDLIEKEWVDKAKQIVERTRDDPYRQNEELTVVKADYMKKRYNKAIKLDK